VNGTLCQQTYHALFTCTFVHMGLSSMATPLVGTGTNLITVEDAVDAFAAALRQFVNALYGAHLTAPKVVYIVHNSQEVLQRIERRLERALSSAGVPQVAAMPQAAPAKKSRSRRDAAVSQQVPQQVDPLAAAKAAAAAFKASMGLTTATPSKKEEEDIDESDSCVICMDDLHGNGKITKLDRCGHSYHAQCIADYFAKVKHTCPSCGTVYSVTHGDQPANGTMTHSVSGGALPGHPGCRTITIQYSIPSGTQGPNHPNSGHAYHGAVRAAYLPDSAEGREILALLRKAFDHRLIFTVGESRTTGASNMVTWNDIHHKTAPSGGTAGYGYPDDTYLKRVRQELAAKGIV